MDITQLPSGLIIIRIPPTLDPEQAAEIANAFVGQEVIFLPESIKIESLNDEDF